MQCCNLIKFQLNISPYPHHQLLEKTAYTNGSIFLSKTLQWPPPQPLKLVFSFRYFQVTKWKVCVCEREAVNRNLFFLNPPPLNSMISAIQIHPKSYQHFSLPGISRITIHKLHNLQVPPL